MKIGITCYPTYGGSGVVATELGREVAECDHEVHFVSYAQPIRLTGPHPNIHYHEVEVPRYPLFDYPQYDLALASRMAEVAENLTTSTCRMRIMRSWRSPLPRIGCVLVAFWRKHSCECATHEISLYTSLPFVSIPKRMIHGVFLSRILAEPAVAACSFHRAGVRTLVSCGSKPRASACEPYREVSLAISAISRRNNRATWLRSCLVCFG